MERKKLNESLNNLGTPMVTGEDVAELLGCGDLYRQGKEEEAQQGQMRESMQKKFYNMFNRINEVEKKNRPNIID
jgi:hypothetical protein